MTKAELVERFVRKPIYITNGAWFIARITKSSRVDVLAAK